MYSRYHLLGIFLAFVLILPVVVLDAKAQEPENILTNPDFEINTAGWTLGLGNPFLIDKKEDSPTKTNVVRASIDIVGVEAWEPEIHSPGFDLVNGKTYTYSLWAKTEPKKTRVLGCSFEQLETYVGMGQSITINEEWKEYHYTGVWTNPNSPPQVVIHIGINNAPEPLADIWFAHFKVYEGKFVEEDLPGKKIAVTPMDRLATAWGQIKSK